MRLPPSRLFLASAISAVATQASAQQPPAPAPGRIANTPAPKILVIDKNALLTGTKAAQDINRQGQAYLLAMQHDLKGEADSLQKDKQTLQQQVAILAPDVKAKKIKDFQSRAAGFQQKALKRQAQVQYGVYLARQELTRALDPILTQIMNERGANLLLDRGAVRAGNTVFARHYA